VLVPVLVLVLVPVLVLGFRAPRNSLSPEDQ